MTHGPPMTVRLLGEFEVRLGGDLVPMPTGAQRLVAVLSLRRRSARGMLAGWLWPDTTQSRAMGRLRTTIWRLNQAAPGLVDCTSGGIDLAGRTEIDVRRLVDDARALLRGAAEAGFADAGAGDLATCVAELLPGWDDEWLTEDREWLRQLRLHALEKRSEELMNAESYGLALEWAMAAVRADPLRESAHRAVIQVHVAEGNLAEARRAYARCSQVLARELGVLPTRKAVAALGGVTGA